jgi:hypothetical protein
MSDSPYDPSPETLDRIRDRAAAEAAAERVAGDGELKAAVDKLHQVERELEDAAKNAPAPPSSGVTYLPEVRPNPVQGHLTVPRIEVRKPRQRTTMRAISAQPLVKLGFASVVNDGEGDVKASLRWSRIALFAAPFVVFAIIGIWRVADVSESPTAPSLPSAEEAAPSATTAPLETAPATAAATASVAPTAVAPSADVAPTDLAPTGEAPSSSPGPASAKTSAPTKKSSPDQPTTPAPRPSSGGWKPEF